jgi:cyanophycinase
MQNMAFEQSTPAGTLVIIGGNENKGEARAAATPDKPVPLEILKAFKDAIKTQDATVEVITTASSIGDEVFAEYKNVFESLGVGQVRHIHHKSRKAVLEDDLTERVNAAHALFFSGGDQLLLTSLYGGSSFLMRLKERYVQDTIVIGGTSAGAMAMSDTMIYAGNKDVQQISGEVKLTTGLGFLKNVCIDTHFVDRGRFVRLAQVVATNPATTGIGIEEDTALIIRNGSEGEIIGGGTIITIDGSEIESSNITAHGEGEPITIRNLRVNILSRGEKYNLGKWHPAHR